jgi:hypothetical protein
LALVGFAAFHRKRVVCQLSGFPAYIVADTLTDSLEDNVDSSKTNVFGDTLAETQADTQTGILVLKIV